MLSRFKKEYGYLLEILNLLPSSDKRKILTLGILQFIMSILDLVGILLIGIVTSLGLSAISAVVVPESLNFIYQIPLIGSLPLEKLIIWLSLISAVLLMGKTIASALIMRKVVGFLVRREAIISTRYIENISRNSPKWQLEKSPQYISGVALEGVNSAITLSLGQLVSITVEILSMLLIFIGISTFDLSITIPSFIFFVVTGWLSLRFLSHRTRIAGKEEFFLGISSRDLIKNIVIGSRELYLSNKQESMNSRFASQRIRNYEAVRTRAMAALIPKYVSEVSLILGGILIASYQFAIKDARGAITGLVIFVGLSSRLLPSLLRVQGAILQIRGSSEASKNFLLEFKLAAVRLNTLEPTKLDTNSNEPKPADFSSRIILKEAVAKHSQGSDFSIGGISLEIKEGEFFAIAGPSGSGKTTLADLMLGIITLESGEVTIGGVPPSEAIQKWPSKIRYVPQDVQLIPGTILENIMWPDMHSSLSEIELEELFDVVELSLWLQTLEKGWNTQINSLGNNLSGGQKQRIGIARALYSSPNVILLDESTSSLDMQTEQEIVNNIIIKMKDITRVVIAHRISTIRSADRIAYLKNGVIETIGTFEEIKEHIPDFDNEENV